MVKKSGKAVPKKPASKAVTKAKSARRVKSPEYKSLRLQKRIKHPVKLPSVWALSKTAWRTLWSNKGLFAGITLIYGLLNLVLAQSLSGSTDITTLKEALDALSSGHFAALGSGLSIFAVLVGSAGKSTSATGGAYQLFLGLTASLAVIWALRQAIAGTKVRVRDSYYRGMYPLIPFILVLLVVALQLIPAVIGSSLYALVVNNGIAVLFVEKFAWSLMYGLLTLLSLYMISSSVFALYISTLPDMTPMKALRSARALVRYRRWTVLRKIVCLPIILLVVGAVIMLPIIIWLTPLAQVIFFFLSMFALVAVHAYMYTLYRELLNE